MSTTSDPVTTPTIEEWFQQNPWIYGVIGAVALGLVALFFLVCCCCCCWYRRRRHRYEVVETNEEGLVQNNGCTTYGSTAGPDVPSTVREPSVVDEMNRQRREQEKAERTNAKDAVDYHIRNTRRNAEVTPLLDMGSRMQKYWFKIQSSPGGGETLLTIAPLSQRCPVKLDTSTGTSINSLMETLQDHPYIHPIQEVAYLANKGQLIICQSFVTKGSLKDIIYKATPTSDWSQKYSRRSKGLSADKVATYGRHILEAMRFLYSKGFPPLGHVQSGNCFVHEGVCQLSGYENTILGYKTRLYRLLKEHMDKIDVIMFGHLIFEMSCGYELTSLAPAPNDLKCVNNERVRDVLQFIFEQDFPHDIDDILKHEFFDGVAERRLVVYNDDMEFSSDVKSLLKTVGRGKPVPKQPKGKKSKTPLMPPTKKGESIEVVTDREPRKKPTPTPRNKAQDNTTST